MAELSRLRLAVAGAGVLGLCVALRAAAAGAKVEVWDPASLGDNASGIAAGMIAPAGEVLLDPDIANAFELLRAGRDGWRDIARLAPGLSLDTSGTTILFPDAQALAAARGRMTALGGAVAAPELGTLPSFASSADDHALFTPDDWRLQPQAALGALKAGVIAHGGLFKTDAMTPSDMTSFDTVILAAGMRSRTFSTLAPELLNLTPIKGQLVRFFGGPTAGPVVRSSDIYLAPQPGGALAGATMEVGRNDRIIDADAIENLRRRALRLMPALAGQSYEGRAGVRAATADGLPMVGPSRRPGLLLATGARRNGWLLAPLVSEILLSYLSGGDGGPFAPALDPRRFLRA